VATATTAVGAGMSAASPSCWNLLDTLHSSDYERHRYWESGSGWVSSGTRYSWRRARDHYRQAKRSEKRHLRSAPPSLKVLVKTGLRSVSGKKKQKLEKKWRKVCMSIFLLVFLPSPRLPLFSHSLCGSTFLSVSVSVFWQW
jgi:hypothetical protein